jgi:imidazolonepropionase-like amidohydrolase
MQAVGLTPMQVLVAATAGGARALGRDDLGTVAPGKAADLAILPTDPTKDVAAYRTLTHVVRGGVLRPVSELAGD